MKVRFIIAKTVEITAQYELVKLSDHQTFFKYTSTNRPMKWFYNLLLLFSNDKAVIGFVQRVKDVAEAKN